MNNCPVENLAFVLLDPGCEKAVGLLLSGLNCLASKDLNHDAQAEWSDFVVIYYKYIQKVVPSGFICWRRLLCRPTSCLPVCCAHKDTPSVFQFEWRWVINGKKRKNVNCSFNSNSLEQLRLDFPPHYSNACFLMCSYT